MRDRFRLPSLVRAINSPIAVPASWITSGALFGLASALILQWSLPAIALAVVVVAALSWLARGVANLVLACIVMLVLVAIAFQAWHFFSPAKGLSSSWLEPCAFGGVVLLLWLGRRLMPQQVSSRTGALIELVAAATSLLIALRFVVRVSAAGSDGAGLFLIGAQDNDAWIGLVGILHNARGVTELTGSSLGAFGSVVPTYLAGVRAASSGVLSAALPLSKNPKVVVSAYGLVVASAPIVVALLVRRMLHLLRPIATLLVWGCATALVVSSCIVWMAWGSLSAALAVPLMLAAAYLVSVRPRLENGRTQVAWLASTLLVFGAGATWIALVPLAGAAIAACCLPVLGFAGRNFRRDYRRTIPAAAVLLFAALVLELELRQQYGNVIGPRGVTALFLAPAGTPTVTGAMQTLMLLLLVAIVWLSSRTRPDRIAPQRSFLTSLLWIVGYAMVVLLATARVTGLPAGYGPTKLQFILAIVWIPLAVIEFVSRLDIGQRELSVVAIIVLAVLWISTVQTGPIYDATTRHWPIARPKPVWYDTVVREAKLGNRVLCLSEDQTAPAQLPLGAQDYFCTRFASSLQGKNDGTAQAWEWVSRGSQSISADISNVENAKDKPWRIVVIGSMKELHNPRAWWAPIVKLPGLKFVPVPVPETPPPGS